MRKPKVFTIPPGIPFLRTFAEALLNGEIIDGFSQTISPLEIAAATLYVPTQRAAQVLAEIFIGVLGPEAALLPVISPLGHLEEAETLIIPQLEPDDFSKDLPRAASEIMRKLQLSELIMKWADAITHAIVSVNAQGLPVFDEQQAFAVANSNADFWHLAGELTSLIDELIIEGVDWKELNLRVLPEFDSYWNITLQFLNIAMAQWPEILANQGLIDKSRRQVLLIEKQIASLENQYSSGPVIAIGSTGSTVATAKLLRAITENSSGAIVLPGLDQDLDDITWTLLDKDAATHPQALMARLLKVLDIERHSIISLGQPTSPLVARRRFLSEALRPANSTEQWVTYRSSLQAEELTDALENVTLIEAADEREEALCIAIALRETLEIPGRTAALLTPSRNLAQRVQTELSRWDIAVEDSAGEKLRHSAYGVLAELVMNAAVTGLTAASCAAILQHPLVRLNLPRNELVRLTQLLEIGVLRAPLSEAWADNPASAVAAAKKAAQDVYAHPATRRINDSDWVKIEALLNSLADAFSSLSLLREKYGLAQWIAAHRETLNKLTSGNDIENHSFDAMNCLFDELVSHARNSMMFGKESYALFVAEVANEIVIREAVRSHPRLTILGLLEGRLMEADVMILGGLDETIWPPAVRTDAFLNRPMRAVLGLSPPERRLGQTTHDFAQAFGNSNVMLTRSAKRNGAPTVASRIVQRMAAVAGDTWQKCRARGEVYINFSRALDRPTHVSTSYPRPNPRPRVELRPTQLSVTKIETLRRDPYAIFAEYILKIKPLESFKSNYLTREIGTAVHTTLESFVRAYPKGNLPERAYEKLRLILQDILATRFEEPDFAVFWRPWLERGLNFYLDFENRRRDKIAQIHVETDGRVAIPLSDGSRFILTSRADRIEENYDRSISIVDYKTGTLPGNKEVIAGFSPQLTLEAAIAMKGGYGLEKITNVAEAIYLKIGGKNGGQERKIDPSKTGNKTFSELAEIHFIDLINLLNHFRDPKTPYPSQPYPKFLSHSHTYDHLARVKEWSVLESSENEA